VLEDLLPLGAGRVSHATLRPYTLGVGAQLDERVSEPDEYDWPESRREPVLAARNLSVALDRTYIRADDMVWLGKYHVVAGLAEREGQWSHNFAWVAQDRLSDSETFIKAAVENNSWTLSRK
jgi:hypothetical protein